MQLNSYFSVMKYVLTIYILVKSYFDRLLVYKTHINIKFVMTFSQSHAQIYNL